MWLGGSWFLTPAFYVPALLAAALSLRRCLLCLTTAQVLFGHPITASLLSYPAAGLPRAAAASSLK